MRVTRSTVHARRHLENLASGSVCLATVCASGNIQRTVRAMLSDRISNRAAISARGRLAATISVSTW